MRFTARLTPIINLVGGGKVWSDEPGGKSFEMEFSLSTSGVKIRTTRPWPGKAANRFYSWKLSNGAHRHAGMAVCLGCIKFEVLAADQTELNSGAYGTRAFRIEIPPHVAERLYAIQEASRADSNEKRERSWRLDCRSEYTEPYRKAQSSCLEKMQDARSREEIIASAAFYADATVEFLRAKMVSLVRWPVDIKRPILEGDIGELVGRTQIEGITEEQLFRSRHDHM